VIGGVGVREEVEKKDQVGGKKEGRVV